MALRKTASSGMMLVGDHLHPFTVIYDSDTDTAFVADHHSNRAGWTFDPEERICFTRSSVVKSLQLSGDDKTAASLKVSGLLSVPWRALTRQAHTLYPRDIYLHTMWMYTNGGRLDSDTVQKAKDLVLAIERFYKRS